MNQRKCGTPCEIEPGEQEEAQEQAETEAYDQAMSTVLAGCSTEQLVEALKSRGYNRVILEDS